MRFIKKQQEHFGPKKENLRRVRTGFLFRPKTISNYSSKWPPGEQWQQETRWLEWTSWVEQYMWERQPDGRDGYWFPIHWDSDLYPKILSI